MIIISYPIGLGGNFMASLIALLRDGAKNQINYNDGSLHLTQKGYQHFHYGHTSDLDSYLKQLKEKKEFAKNSIVIGHIKDIKFIRKQYPTSKIICMSISDEFKAVQEKNFILKVLYPKWSLEFYNRFKANDEWPDFDKIENMPQWVINDIIKINSKYIDNWEYNLPIDLSNIFFFDYLTLTDTDKIILELTKFLELDPADNNIIDAKKFIKEYVEINKLYN